MILFFLFFSQFRLSSDPIFPVFFPNSGCPAILFLLFILPNSGCPAILAFVVFLPSSSFPSFSYNVLLILSFLRCRHHEFTGCPVIIVSFFFWPSFSFPSFSLNVLVIPSFYTSNFALNIYLNQQLSELREFCREFKNAVRFVTIFCTKLKTLQNWKMPRS